MRMDFSCGLLHRLTEQCLKLGIKLEINHFLCKGRSSEFVVIALHPEAPENDAHNC